MLLPLCFFFFFCLMIRRPPRSTRVRSSAASDVYKRQGRWWVRKHGSLRNPFSFTLSLIHISEPTRLLSISYAVFCLKKKKHIRANENTKHLVNRIMIEKKKTQEQK